MGFFGKMFSHIGEDWYIIVCAAVSVACLMMVYRANQDIDDQFEAWKQENHYSKRVYSSLTLSYSIFVTLITIFPLLGMLGTVKSLLMLNFADDNAMLNARNSFFDALTSTAWGIIFAIIFKIINAFVSKHTEDNIEKISELINHKATDIGSGKADEEGQDHEA